MIITIDLVDYPVQISREAAQILDASGLFPALLHRDTSPSPEKYQGIWVGKRFAVGQITQNLLKSMYT
jgi:hypothetical protein